MSATLSIVNDFSASRHRSPDLDIIQVRSLLIDPRSRRATVDGRPVDLTVKEFQLLIFLARDPTCVFSRRELMEGVWMWPDAYDRQTRTLDVFASRLRRKLGGEWVVNVWGVGYALCAPDLNAVRGACCPTCGQAVRGAA